MTRFSPSANSNILEPSAFLEPYPKPPCVPSYPALLLPTCPSPSRMGKILVGGWHSELGVETPVIPTLFLPGIEL